jgi:hypothetical protein
MLHCLPINVRIIEIVEFAGMLSVPAAEGGKRNVVRCSTHGVTEFTGETTAETVPMFDVQFLKDTDVIFICVCVWGTYPENWTMHVTAPAPGTMNERLAEKPVTDEVIVLPMGLHHGDALACESVKLTVA